MLSKKVSTNFALGIEEVSGVARAGLGPLILESIVNDIKTSPGVYLLKIDDDQALVKTDFLARCWTRENNQLVTKYITSKWEG